MSITILFVFAAFIFARESGFISDDIDTLITTSVIVTMAFVISAFAAQSKRAEQTRKKAEDDLHHRIDKIETIILRADAKAEALLRDLKPASRRAHEMASVKALEIDRIETVEDRRLDREYHAGRINPEDVEAARARNEKEANKKRIDLEEWLKRHDPDY